MFEIDQYDKRMHAEPPAVPRHGYSTDDNIDRVSLLFWGEHCTECAAPECYKTCDLYQRRPDTRCRRFRFGVYRNRAFRSLRGYGAEVVFKQWGVLATTGNTLMVSRSKLLWAERLIGWTAPAVNAIGPVVGRLTRDERWIYPTFGLSRRLCQWLHRRNGGSAKPDAFVLEVYNPGTEPVRMQLAMSYSPDAQQKLTATVQILPRFSATVTFPPGYCRHEFERRLFQSVTDSGLTFGVSLTPEADTAARLVFLSADFITWRGRKASDTSRPAIKCVVWDLDNTLWEGTLAEDDNVRLKDDVKQLLKVLDERGILLSIASKNTHEAAWSRLESLGIAEYFLAPQINWAPKSENIRTIAKRLNIGLDTLAFIDDNPFELGEVGAAIPEVTCIDARRVAEEVPGGARFQGSVTSDARNRRRYYQEAIRREDKQVEFGQDYLRFLSHCEVQLEVRKYSEEDFSRVAELVQRTNQLNFSGRRYDRDQLHEILQDPGIEKYVLYCSDKFGAYGLIGFGMLRHAGRDLEIQDLMLSCRVQGKLVEQAFFTHLERHHNPNNAVRLRVNFNETKRNQPARHVLESNGFQKLDTEGGFAREVRPDSTETSGIVRVKCGACCHAEAVALRG